MTMKNFVTTLTAGCVAAFASTFTLPALAVELPALVSGEELESIKGTSVNRNSSIGSNSSLTVGSSTTFGASVNLNAKGTEASTSSLLKLNSLGVDSEGLTDLEESCPTGDVYVHL